MSGGVLQTNLMNKNKALQEIKLHPKQSLVFWCPKRFRVLNAGRRFGKTTLAIAEMIRTASLIPGSKSIYFAPTISQARDIAWTEMKNQTKNLWARDPNESRLEIYLKSSTGDPSQIWLRGAENIESARGNKIHFLVVDEISSIRNWTYIWNEVLRPALTDTLGGGLFISTPHGYGHFFDLYNKQNTDDDYAAFTFTSYDNPYLMPTEIDKAKLEIGEDSFRQEYLAEFVSVSGQVYKEWKMDAQFTTVTYDPNLEVNVSFDFGVNDPTALIWFQRSGGEFRIIDYYEQKDASIDHFVHVLKSKPYRQPSLYTGDIAGRSRSIGTNTSPIEEYAKHKIFIRTRSVKSIEDQIRITHKYVPSLFVSNKLDRFRDIMLNYRYPEKNGLNQQNENPIHDEYSHGARAMEYYFLNIDGMDQEGLNYNKTITQNNFKAWEI
jgi:hypothetical protein